MLAETYILIKGPMAGEIRWLDVNRREEHPDIYQSYADFEREALERLDADMAHVGLSGTDGYFLVVDDEQYTSHDLIRYCGCDYKADFESSRLLKRAEFLKAVCEKEGVAWLPEKPPFQFDPLHHAGKLCTRCKTMFPMGSEHTCEPHPSETLGEEGSYQPCRICGERIRTENEAIAGHHYKCAKPDAYTKAEIDERMDVLVEIIGHFASVALPDHKLPMIENGLADLRRRFL